jgi:cAMP-dependent protein kinase regulator
MLDSEVVNTQLESKYKSEETKQFIMTVLKRHFLFSKLQDYELDELLDLMDERFASEGEVIIREGEQGDEFYILEEGKVEFLVQGNRVGTSDDIQFKGFFGDLALLSNSPRAATITALRDCNMWTLSRQFFRQAMVTSSSKQSNMLIEFLSKIKLFSGLDAQSMASLARLVIHSFYLNFT